MRANPSGFRASTGIVIRPFDVAVTDVISPRVFRNLSTPKGIGKVRRFSYPVYRQAKAISLG
jgi:hypothetical protein